MHSDDWESNPQRLSCRVQHMGTLSIREQYILSGTTKMSKKKIPDLRSEKTRNKPRRKSPILDFFRWIRSIEKKAGPGPRRLRKPAKVRGCFSGLPMDVRKTQQGSEIIHNAERARDFGNCSPKGLRNMNFGSEGPVFFFRGPSDPRGVGKKKIGSSGKCLKRRRKKSSSGVQALEKEYSPDPKSIYKNTRRPRIKTGPWKLAISLHFTSFLFAHLCCIHPSFYFCSAFIHFHRIFVFWSKSQKLRPFVKVETCLRPVVVAHAHRRFTWGYLEVSTFMVGGGTVRKEN